jgi:hypothetical protein
MSSIHFLLGPQSTATAVSLSRLVLAFGVLLRECGWERGEKERPLKQLYPPPPASQCRRRIVPDLAHNIIIIISMTKG